MLHCAHNKEGTIYPIMCSGRRTEEIDRGEEAGAQETSHQRPAMLRAF